METYKDHIIQSPDMNAERLETLRSLFPDWFTQEGRLDINEVKKAVSPDSVDETERYEFRWFGKSNAKRNAFTPTRATLHYDESRSVNPETTENVIIEGDNLEVLKVLTSAYRGQVKIIYIDPPYNADALTAYNDNYTEERIHYWEESGISEDGVIVDSMTVPEGRKHSTWMSDIYARILKARDLLADDGIILISINDKELAHLKKICEEIFMPENFIAQFVWITDGNFDNQAKVKTCHEYILLYAKNANKFDFPNLVDPNIKDDSKLNNHHKNDIIVENYHVKYDVEISSGWGARAQLDQFMIEENKWNPVKDTKNQNTRFVLTSSGGIDCIKDRGIKSHVISVLQNLGGTQTATSELESLGICGFRYPKPTQLLEYILQLINDKDCWVLDFYAGTGTTGHAVTNLNFKDGGTRKYILVQFPAALPNEEKEAIKRGFKKISDITIARNKAVIEKTKASFDGKLITPEDQQQLDKLGFKVFTLSKSSFPRTDFTPDPEKSEEENLELFQQYVSQKEQQLSMPFDDNELITEILISRGFMLTYKLAHQTMFTANTVYLATDSVKTAYICVDNQLANATVDYFMQHTETKFICIERALDSTKKFNLKKKMGDKFFAF